MQTYLGYILSNPNSSAFTPMIYSSQALRVSGLVSPTKSKKTNLSLATGFNSSANDRFLMFFEASAVPSNGAVPAYVMPVPGKALFSWAPSQGGRVFDKLCYAVSTTAATLTISTDTVWIDIEGATL